MAWALVNHASTTLSANAASVAVTISGVTAGNLITAWWKWEGGGASNVSISDGTSSLVMLPQVNHANGDLSAGFGYLLSANSGNRTYTASWTGGRSWRALIVSQWSHSDSAAFDDSSENSGATGPLATGNITTTPVGATGLVIVGYGDYSTSTPSDRTINGVASDGERAATGGDGSSSEIFWRLNVAAFTDGAGAAGGIGGGYIACIAAFKESSGAAILTPYNPWPLRGPILAQ